MKQELVMKLIEMLISSESGNQDSNAEVVPSHKLNGKHVIIRARDSGCHFGILESVNGRHVVLNKSRRMYRWWAAREMTLTAVAKFGLNLNRKELRIQSEIDGQEILDACEILPCTPECIDSFSKVEAYNEQ